VRSVYRLRICLEFGWVWRSVVDTPFGFAQLQLVFLLNPQRHESGQEQLGAALAAWSWVDFASPTIDSRFGTMMDLLKMVRNATAWTSR
jgi:hypothetical protein